MSRQTIIRLAQERFYFSELDDLKSRRPINSHSKILKLKPFLDHRGLLSVVGRIDDAPVAYDTRHPIILPASARVTELIVHQTHLEYAHASPERTLYKCRKMFWIVKGRATVKKIVNKCRVCKRNSVQPLSPMMAKLPSCRLQPNSPNSRIPESTISDPLK